MPDIVVKKSRFGKGGFAGRGFAKGETICFLKGKQMGMEIFAVLKAKNRTLLDPLQIGDAQFIDLDEPYLFINHSCNPNAGVRGKNELFALRAIAKGDEVFFDYSTTMDGGLDCRCGEPNCRGKISDFLALPRKTQQWYLKRGAVPDFIKKKIIRNKK